LTWKSHTPRSITAIVAPAVVALGKLPASQARPRNCVGPVTAVTDIPATFVSRTDGFRILGQALAGYTCDSTEAATGTPAPGPAQPVDIKAVFDGWGYTHMFKATPNAGEQDPPGRVLRAA
jgi:hypothetical protein